MKTSFLLTVVLVAFSASAASWRVDGKALHPKANRTAWDGAGELWLKPRDQSKSRLVFTDGISVPSAFDAAFRLTYSSRDGDPCRIGFVICGRDGREQEILVRADGVGPLAITPAILNGCPHDFLVQATNGVLTVYRSEPDASYLRLGEIPLAVAPAAINFRWLPKYELSILKLSVGPHGPVPCRTTQGLVAARASREQPLVGASEVPSGRVKSVPVPVDRRATLRLAFDKSEEGGILYVKGRVPTALPIYVFKSSFTPPCDVPPDWKRGVKYEFPHAMISVGGYGKQCVVPMMERYASSRTLFEDGKNILREWRLLDFDARRHVLALDFNPVGNGDVQLWADGSYLTTFAGPTNVYFWAKSGSRWRLDERAQNDERYLPLDFAANPRALAFAAAQLDGIAPGRRILDGIPYEVAKPLDSQDVALAKCAMGSYGLGSNPYRARSPLDGYTMAVHYRVPPAHYVKAHVLFALDDAQGKKRTMRLRLARYFKPAAGSNMVEDVPVALTDAVLAKCPFVGSVVRGGRAYPIRRLSVDLPAGRCLDFATHGDYIDFEAVGESDDRRDSAVNLFAVTLERAPFTLDFVQKATGNVFAEDEEDKSLTVRLAYRRDFRGTLSWTLAGETEKAALDGRSGTVQDVKVPLEALRDWGLYDIGFAVRDEAGNLILAHDARTAIVPPRGRLADANITNSPYCAWYFDRGIHGGVKDHDVIYSLLQRLGVRKVSWSGLSREESVKYQLLGNGAVKFPSPWDFDRKAGKFPPKGGRDGETWVVENLKDQIASKVWVDHIMVWHENAPPAGVPEEVMGLAVPAATDSDRFYAAYFNECGRIARKHFPHLRLKIGNWLGSSGACFRPFRAGAKTEYFDCLGMEPYNGNVPPEVFSLDDLQAQLLSRETIEHYAKRPVPVDAAFEFTSRPLVACGSEETQAQYFVRDALIGLANGYRLIPIAGPGGGDDGYYDSEWGGNGYTFRKPYLYPAQLCVAVAVLTKMIDAPVDRRLVNTGSKSVYALAFKRTDGRHVTVFWTTRGTVEFEPGVKGETVSMTGVRGKVGGWFGRKTMTAGESPAYLLSDESVSTVKIVARHFPENERMAERARTVAPLAALSEVDVSPDAAFANRGMPTRLVSSNMTVMAVNDAVRGPCLEIAVGAVAPPSKFHSEFTTLRLKEPATLPDDAKAVGLWVKGDGGWGNVRFEIEDGFGKVYKNLQPSTFDPVDPRGRMAFDFEDWVFLGYPIDVPNATGWTRCSRGLSPVWMKPPVKVRAITIALNRYAPFLNEMTPVPARVRIGGLSGVMK